MAEAAGVTPQALGTRDGGDCGTRRWQQGAAGAVEVVVMVIVAEQHGVCSLPPTRPRPVNPPHPNRTWSTALFMETNTERLADRA